VELLVSWKEHLFSSKRMLPFNFHINVCLNAPQNVKDLNLFLIVQKPKNLLAKLNLLPVRLSIMIHVPLTIRLLSFIQF
jgi:hypothetical protein